MQDAYSKNDLRRVREILSNLENGIFDIAENIKVSNKEHLLEQLNYLKQKQQELSQALTKIRNDKTYKQVINIKDMNKYFAEEKVRLETELKQFQNG